MCQNEKLIMDFIREFDWSVSELWYQIRDPSLDWTYSIQTTQSCRIAIMMQRMILDIPAPLTEQDVRPLINLVWSHGVQQINLVPEQYMPFDIYKWSDLITEATFAEFTPAMQNLLDKDGVFILVKWKTELKGK